MGTIRSTSRCFDHRMAIGTHCEAPTAAFNLKNGGSRQTDPSLGDYDRDGKTDLAVFRESEGIWYIVQSASNSTTAIRFGQVGDIPIPSAYVR